jgi:uncharacterized protein
MTKDDNLSEVKIVQTQQFKLEKPLMILGFAGTGLVGGIAASHIINELELKEIAHLKSRHIPPSVVLFEGKLRHPLRIYTNETGKLCVLVCEIPLRSQGAYPLASAILDWAKEQGVNQLVILDGARVRRMPKKRQVFWATEPERLKDFEKKGLKKINTGIIRGISGSLLDECLSRKILGVGLLVPAFDFMPDPEGAATLVEALNEVYGLKVSSEKLLGAAEKIKENLKLVARRYKNISADEEKRGDGQRSYVS